MQKLYTGAFLELTKSETQGEILSILQKRFEDLNINYILLKGSSLNKLYPKPELRTMSDLDILIHLDDYTIVRENMIDLGFTEEYESNHELVWRKGSVLVEIHKKLVPTYNEDFYQYFGDGWKNVVTSETSRCFYTPEDEFIYIFTHFAKHYRGGGIGLRQFCDIYLYLKYYSLDLDYVETELSKLKLLAFYKNVSNAISAFFLGEDFDELSELICETVISNGAFGTKSSNTNALILRSARGTAINGKHARLYLFKMKVFPKKEFIESKYPYLVKKPWLLPIAWISRWFSVIFKDRGKISTAVSQINSAKSADATAFEENLNKVGLDFNFKEKS